MKRKRSEFRCHAIIGRGAYGTVMKASLDNDLYALKLLEYEDAYDLSDFLRSSFREIFFGNYSHVLSMGRTLGGLMPLGITTLRRALFTSEAAFRSLHGLVLQLHRLHIDGILHHDIKPENIILYENPRRHELVDFSLSVRSRACRKTNVYTIWYRAPEILLGQMHDQTADIWALGASFLNIFLKQVIIGGTLNESEMLARIVSVVGTQGYGPLVERYGHVQSKLGSLGLSESLQDLLSGMLTLDPELRMTSLDVVHHRFWSGPVDTSFYSGPQAEDKSDRLLDFEPVSVPVFYKRVSLERRVAAFDSLVQAAHHFHMPRTVVVSAFFFWDTSADDTLTARATAFFAAASIEQTTDVDLDDVSKWFGARRFSLEASLFRLPTKVTKVSSLILETFDDDLLWSIVESSSFWCFDGPQDSGFKAKQLSTCVPTLNRLR